jgi:amidase
MAGFDRQDPITRRGRKRGLSNYAKFLDVNGLKGARIGVARNMAGSNPRILKIFETGLEVMRKLGAVLVDPADVKYFDKFNGSEREVLHYEFKADLNDYLESLDTGARVHSLEDVIRFHEGNRDQMMPYFGQERMIAANEKGSLMDRKYKAALAKNLRLARKQGIDATMKKYRLDAIVVPSGGPAWTIDLANGDAPNWDMESTSPAAVAGYPHITVPAGYLFGLPVGLSFFSTAWMEPMLIKLAYAFEQATQFRRQPRFLPTANLKP